LRNAKSGIDGEACPGFRFTQSGLRLLRRAPHYFEVDAMTRRELLRRVVLVCCSFGRNLAYYRVGQEGAFSPLLRPSHPHASFWLQANSSFLYVTALEWCKLIGDKKGKHSWHNIVTDPPGFETDLLAKLGMTAVAFAKDSQAIRHYRDKFVAHLDSEPVIHVPGLTTAQTAVWFYHEHIVTKEASAGDLAGLVDTPDKMIRGYEVCQKEASNIFAHALNHNGSNDPRRPGSRG
jgi:hypothetical protein